ncbi:MAG: radical SAM protein [Gemmatimonadota bacterium]|nr:radical SAM protein [Gemmatimonadota bacterium]
MRLDALDTLWFNTGTLCNIECANCYIESSPLNDRLVYLTPTDVRLYLDEIAVHGLPTREIGFTGGEPFMNPDMVQLLREVLDRGFRALVLTNAMQPLQRPGVQAALIQLRDELARASAAPTAANGSSLPSRQAARLVFRVSLDHYTEALHDTERGAGSWAVALEGMRWLSREGFSIDVAGRTRWGEAEADARSGYADLFAREGFGIDASDPAHLVLFPEMDEKADVPEITVDCWGILGKRPSDVMCATSRMVVKRRGADRPTVLACTLLPYDERFDLGPTLADAAQDVPLNHPHCAKFCVLGGGSCSS